MPGAQYAPVTTQLSIKPQPQAPEASVRESFSKRLQKGTIPGLKYATGVGIAAGAKAPKQAATKVTLASSNPPSKEEKKTALKPVRLPSQDDKGTPKANN